MPEETPSPESSGMPPVVPHPLPLADGAARTQEPRSRSPLDSMRAAVRSGDETRCLQILAQEPSLAHAPSLRGGSLALEAYERELPRVADAIMQARRNGLDLDVHEAAAMGLPNGVRSALTEDPLAFESQGPAGFFPLHRAAYRGHVEAAMFLLEAGAEPSVRSENGARLTPLHSAVAGMVRFAGEAARGLDTIKLLLAAGADATAEMEGGWTPGSAADRYGLEAAVSLLVGAAPEPESQLAQDDPKSWTPTSPHSSDGSDERASV